MTARPALLDQRGEVRSGSEFAIVPVGDVTRKCKLLDKQKAGKKKMRQFGKVEIPPQAFINALKMDG